MWKQLKIPIIVLVLTLITGTFGFFILEDNVASLLDSFFFTLVTVTTVGYGELTEIFGKRIIIASGEGAKAGLSAKQYLNEKKKESKTT